MGFEIKDSTSNHLHIDYDQSKLVLGSNRFENVDFTASGADLVLTRGMLIGKIAATQLGKVLASASVDGSEIPYGVLTEDITVPDGTTSTLSLVVAGDVSKGLIVLDGADTFATLIGGRSIEDRILGDTLGIKLVATDQLSEFDNS